MPRLIPAGAGQGKIGSGAAAGCSSRLPGGVQRNVLVSKAWGLIPALSGQRPPPAPRPRRSTVDSRVFGVRACHSLLCCRAAGGDPRVLGVMTVAVILFVR